jgi:hypothetical protein
MVAFQQDLSLLFEFADILREPRNLLIQRRDFPIKRCGLAQVFRPFVKDGNLNQNQQEPKAFHAQERARVLFKI